MLIYSFGGFDNFFSRSSESTPNHQKAPLNPREIVLNDMFYVIIPSIAKYPYVHYHWQCVRGDSEHIDILSYFLKILSFLIKQLTGH